MVASCMKMKMKTVRLQLVGDRGREQGRRGPRSQTVSWFLVGQEEGEGEGEGTDLIIEAASIVCLVYGVAVAAAGLAWTRCRCCSPPVYPWEWRRSRAIHRSTGADEAALV